MPSRKVKHRIFSEDHRKKISESLLQYYATHDSPNKGRRGRKHDDNARAKMRLAKRMKPSIPWNKGVKAWNHGLEWPAEVKEKISRGLVVYWMERKASKMATTCGNNNNNNNNIH